jgi:hypothetical protein
MRAKVGWVGAIEAQIDDLQLNIFFCDDSNLNDA